MNRVSLHLVIALCLGLLGGKPAQAALAFSFTPDGSAANFSVEAGQTISLSLYLSGDARLTSQGLYSSGVTVTYGYAAGTGGVAIGNASISQAQLEPYWTNTSLNFVDIDNGVGSQYAILEGIVSGPPVTPVKPASGTDYIKLGSITLSAGQVGNITNLTLSDDLNVASINLLYNAGSGDALDGQISFAGATLTTITTVPEPTSLASFGLAVCIIPWLRRSAVARRSEADEPITR